MDLNAAGAVGAVVTSDYSDPQVALEYVKYLLVEQMHGLIGESISNARSVVANLQTMQLLERRVQDRMAQQTGRVDANVVNTYHEGEQLAQRFASDSGNLGGDLAESQALLQDLRENGVTINATIMYPVLKSTTTTTDASGTTSSSTSSELVWMSAAQRGSVSALTQKDPSYGHPVFSEKTGTEGNSVETKYECLDEFANLRLAPDALRSATAQVASASDVLQEVLQSRTDESMVSVAYLNRTITDLNVTSENASKAEELRRIDMLLARSTENIKADLEVLRRLEADTRPHTHTTEGMKQGKDK